MIASSLESKAERLADRIEHGNFKQSELDFSGEARLAEEIASRINEGEKTVERPGFNPLSLIVPTIGVKEELKANTEQSLADRADRIVTMMERERFDDQGAFAIFSKDERTLAQALKSELEDRGLSAGLYVKREVEVPDSLPYMADKKPEEAKASWSTRVSDGGDLAPDKSAGMSKSQD